MRHNTAAQKGEDGGWHYVSMGRHGGHAIGACAYHEPHATELEARECFSAYQRENILLRKGALSRWSDCSECDAPAKNLATIAGDGYHSAPLCDEHLTRELAIKHLHLDGPAGDSWES